MSYRDEEVARLQVEVADLRAENRKLRDRAPESKREWKMPKIDLDKVALWTLYFFGTAFIGVLLYLAVSAAHATDTITFCYLQHAGPGKVYLKGHVDWSSDKFLSEHKDVNDAVAAAAQMSCPMSRPRSSSAVSK